jgi:O-acetylhomoserine/O-acetylserine sulfhydrylase-like pyridoxal-dependent enzyme
MYSMEELWQFETLCIHGGYQPDPLTHSRQVPLYMTSSYTFANSDEAAAVFNAEQEGYVYTRINNPTNDVLEKRMAMLEGMEAGLVTSTGLSAATLILASLAQAGDEVVLSPRLYGGAYRLFSYNAPRMGITPVWVDLDDPQGWEKAITPKTRFLYLETPGNPTLNVIDIEHVANLAKSHGIPLVVDNTFCTPYLQNPAKLGADIVMHSTTKYIAGNSTVMGGMILGSQSYIDSVRCEDYRNMGPAGSPFNSWMLLMSLETLSLRMDKHCSNAQQVVHFLQEHPLVEQVIYPGLPSHPQYEIAKKQMRNFGGMLAFEVKGGAHAGKTFIDNLRLCSIVANLGDSRTLAIHPASTTHLPLSDEEQRFAGITPGMVRMSVGIENPVDIINDIEQALDAMPRSKPSKTTV